MKDDLEIMLRGFRNRTYLWTGISFAISLCNLFVDDGAWADAINATWGFTLALGAYWYGRLKSAVNAIEGINKAFDAINGVDCDRGSH